MLPGLSDSSTSGGVARPAPGKGEHERNGEEGALHGAAQASGAASCDGRRATSRKTGLRWLFSSMRLLLCHGGWEYSSGRRPARSGRPEVAQGPVDRAVHERLRGVDRQVVHHPLALELECPSAPPVPARGLGAELGDHERQVRVRGVQGVEVAAEVGGRGGRLVGQVLRHRAVPAEVLVHPEHVEVLDARRGVRLPDVTGGRGRRGACRRARAPPRTLRGCSDVRGVGAEVRPASAGSSASDQVRIEGLLMLLRTVSVAARTAGLRTPGSSSSTSGPGRPARRPST